jgi:hypothetical protein
MRTLDPAEDSDEEEIGPLPPKWPCPDFEREFIAGLVTSPLREFVRKVKDCDRMVNDKGKFLMHSIINLVQAFDVNITSNK